MTGTIGDDGKGYVMGGSTYDWTFGGPLLFTSEAGLIGHYLHETPPTDPDERRRWVDERLDRVPLHQCLDGLWSVL